MSEPVLLSILLPKRDSLYPGNRLRLRPGLLLDPRWRYKFTMGNFSEVPYGIFTLPLLTEEILPFQMSFSPIGKIEYLGQNRER